MPTYDYKCNACSHAFEQFQSMKDKPLKKCPRCGKSALERLIGTGAAVIFKGSGFYQTDYRSESYRKAAEAESKASSGAGGGGENTSGEAKATETKPAETKAADAKPASETKSSAEPSKAGGGTVKVSEKASNTNAGSKSGGSSKKNAGERKR